MHAPRWLLRVGFSLTISTGAAHCQGSGGAVGCENGGGRPEQGEEEPNVSVRLDTRACVLEQRGSIIFVQSKHATLVGVACRFGWVGRGFHTLGWPPVSDAGGNRIALHSPSKSLSFASRGSVYLSKPMQSVSRAKIKCAARITRANAHHAAANGEQILERGSVLWMSSLGVPAYHYSLLKRDGVGVGSPHVFSLAPSQKSGGLTPSRNATRWRAM